MSSIVEIFTDGACRGNPGVGGWGALLRYENNDQHLFGAEKYTTNNRMELLATIMALESLPDVQQVRLMTDSQYVKKGITEWIKKWIRQNWKNSSNIQVKNVDLWQRLYAISKRHQIEWLWVKGHSGHTENEIADQLANQGINEFLQKKKESKPVVNKRKISTMRQIVLDTETTGLSTKQGHRIIEIGCVEILNRRVTKQQYHQYIQPDRKIDIEAQRVHGITNEFLQDKPRFADIMQSFIKFIQGTELIIHNAPFDVGFINNELRLFKKKQPLLEEYVQIKDTLALAKKLHPGQKNNLDALCKRYYINNFSRKLHGALLDAEILAEVYLAMTGGQVSLLSKKESVKYDQNTIKRISADRKPLSMIKPNEEELVAHTRFIKKIDQVSDGKCLWHNL